MRKRLILLSALLLVLVNLFCVTGTYAWFTSSGSGSKGTFDSGLVQYIPGGHFVNMTAEEAPDGTTRPGDLIVPGQNMIEAPLTLQNASNVKTKLKVVLTYSFRLKTTAVSGASTTAGDAGTTAQPTTATTAYDPEGSVPASMADIFTYEIGAGWQPGLSPAEHTNKSVTYYYGVNAAAPTSAADQGAVILPDALTQPFDVITSMKLADVYPGFRVDEQLVVTLSYYARQADYVDSWDKITEFSAVL